MGKYGGNPNNLAWIIGPKVHARHFMALSDVVSLEKYGPQATVLTGELGKYQGIPIIVSAQAREDLNTTGTYDSTTTNNGGVLLVNRPAWIFGRRRDITLKVWEDVQFDQIYLVGTARGDFQTPWTSDAVAVMGVDVDLS